MTRDTKIRLIAFAIVSALGLTYVGGNYLGIVDRILGRGYNVNVILPASGGIYEGAEATYRGVKIGKVDKMTVDRDGLRVRVALKEDAGTRASSWSATRTRSPSRSTVILETLPILTPR